MIDLEQDLSSNFKDSYPNTSPVEDLIPMINFKNYEKNKSTQNNFEILSDLKYIKLKENLNKSQYLQNFLININELNNKNIFKIQNPAFNIDGGAQMPVSPTQGVEGTYDEYGYALLTNAAERMQLLESAARMTRTIAEKNTNAVVFCDRGARPLSVLVDVLWGMFSTEPVPPFFFINTNTKNTYNTDASDVPADRIRQLKTWLESEYPEAVNPFREAQRPVVACVVDEIKGTGRSANFVANLVGRAFAGRRGAVFCEWAEVFHPVWRDSSEMVGARTVYGEFKSEELQSKMADLLMGDLRKLAAGYVERSLIATV